MPSLLAAERPKTPRPLGRELDKGAGNAGCVGMTKPDLSGLRMV